MFIFESHEEFVNEATIESREGYKGVNYNIMHQAPKGYYIKGVGPDGKHVFNMKQPYFDTFDQAQEHAEMEIEGWLEESLNESSNFKRGDRLRLKPKSQKEIKAMQKSGKEHFGSSMYSIALDYEADQVFIFDTYYGSNARVYAEGGSKNDTIGVNKDRFELVESVSEARDVNDPILMQLRADMMKRQKAKAVELERKKKRIYGKKRDQMENELDDIYNELRDLRSERADLYQDQESEAGEMGLDDFEAQGRHDYYGGELNRVEGQMQKLIKRKNEIELKLSY